MKVAAGSRRLTLGRVISQNLPVQVPEHFVLSSFRLLLEVAQLDSTCLLEV